VDEPTNILVVDDLPEKLLAYKSILEEAGRTVVVAQSGEEALRVVLRHDFAVILLDVQMPGGLDGLETAALIRSRKRSAHTPIIFLTAFADEVRVAEGYAHGAVDYITTPVVPAVLRAKVRVFCDLHRMTQQVRRQAEERIAFAEERTKREAAEEANRRLAFLTRAGEVLGQSLDQDVTARDVAELPLPVLADDVLLVTLHPDGAVNRTYTASRGGAETALDANSNEGAPDSELARAVQHADARGELRENKSIIALPLRGQGRVLAILGLSRRPSNGVFTAADITVARMFASRAASALENAQLYFEVRQADRQKNEFLSMLAHELRNPLAPIRNANEVLRQRATDPSRVLWAQGVIDRQLTHLVRLVDDLLDVSRLTQGKIRLELAPVELADVVAQAVESARPLIDQFRHELDIRVPGHPLQLLGDKARLTQVITNLLNNAAKYTDPGGHITLSLEPASGSALIRVRDTGIGIAPDLLPTVFDLFTQANRSLDRSQGGLGIGLTLVQRLVELHNGSVEAHSEGLGRGSEFVVRLPTLLQLGDENHNGSSSNGDAALAPRLDRLRAVVVDDNVDAAESLADLLRLLGHEVAIAHDGPTGLAAARSFRPDVVLLDIGLPGMDGYEVARRLQSDSDSSAVVVAVSGYGRDEDRRLSREAGMKHHFVKPIEFRSLRMLLDSVCAGRKAAIPTAS